MHKRSSKIRQVKDEEGAGLVTFSAVSFFGNGGKGMMGNNANCVGAAMGDTNSQCS